MLIDTRKSPYAKVYSLPQENIEWTGGLWEERFENCANVAIPHILELFEDKEVFHQVENFRIAAGESTGDFKGTPYGDGDFYKLLEGLMYVAARRNDKDTEKLLDDYIGLIGRAQQDDGYISTKQIIGEMAGNGVTRLSNINDFEAYNFGHLLTAACNHKRMFGKDNFLRIAIKAAGYLEYRYKKAGEAGEMQTEVCPSNYMGLIELYRETGDKRHLDAVKLAISLRDKVENGLDDNQDRIPLLEHDKIIGHAVRSTYLYAGVADLYLETGDEALLSVLYKVWNNLVDKKLYITGGCGALYNGVSPYGTFMDDQKTHQAFGYEYQLPNVTAYNETCGTLGNIFWNHRMFAISPEAKYFDLIERSMLNLTLAAVSLDGDKYFYENPLRRAKKLDYELIWPLYRSDKMWCFCCPTNISRFVTGAQEYAYMVSDSAVYTGMYGPNRAKMTLANGAAFTLVQQTDYPWDGAVRFSVEDAQSAQGFVLNIRVPSWVESGFMTINGNRRELAAEQANTYVAVDVDCPSALELEVCFDMPVRYTVANPMVEEAVNQVAVERGPLVYCMETPDAQLDTLDNLLLKVDAAFSTTEIEILGRRVVAIETQAVELQREEPYPGALYQPLKVIGTKPVPVRMIPYFAWDNRGFGEMRIWMPILYRT